MRRAVWRAKSGVSAAGIWCRCRTSPPWRKLNRHISAGDTALAQAKACGAFTATHQRYWEAARRTRGDAAGTRALIEILLAHRTLPRTALGVAMQKAVDT